MKKARKKKLKSIGVIHRRLLKMWSENVRGRASFKCEFCGIAKGEINKNGKPEKIDAHHFLNKEIKNCPLKYEILNGIAVDPFCHKFGIPSFHRDPITTITWLQKNHPERYEYVLNNSHVRVDLDNRKVLEEIENKLREGKSLDLEKLIAIEKQFPRSTRAPEIKGSLFDIESSSSSES